MRRLSVIMSSSNFADSLVRADNISMRRGKVDILRDVSLAVSRRDFITIIGPNGAGKSTFLKCLLGLVQPDQGTVSRSQSLALGYVPQHASMPLAIPLTVRNFLALRKHASAEAIAQTAAETKVEHLLNKPLQVLSSGELQRILMARALLGNPDLLVLDEPTQNLDVSGQLAFYKLLEKIYQNRNLAVLLVSHDLHLVMSCTHHVVCLYHHICCSGKPQSITTAPEFIQLFGEDAVNHLAVYHHTHNHHHDV